MKKKKKPPSLTRALRAFYSFRTDPVTEAPKGQLQMPKTDESDPKNVLMEEDR